MRESGSVSFIQSATASLTWALPVPVVELGANLQLYHRLLPILYSLRLCNRYGQGPHAAITKLPVELITRIEECLLHASHEKRADDIPSERYYRCFQKACEPHHHVDPEGYALLRSKFLKPGELKVNREEDKWPVHEDEINELLLRNWKQTHAICVRKWAQIAGISRSDRKCFFVGHKKLILKRFGLQVWVNQILGESPFDRSDDNGQRTPPRTVAFLSLPTKQTHLTPSTVGVAKDTFGLLGDRHVWEDHGFAVAITVPKPPSRAEVNRFRRMLKTLRLEPSYEDASKDVDILDPHTKIPLQLATMMTCRTWITIHGSDDEDTDEDA